jgi:hypothetical protein
MARESMNTLKPFRNETDSVRIDDLTIENRIDRIELYGSLQITKDKAGLQAALELKAILDAALAELQKPGLPERIKLRPAENVKNPFD